MAAATPSGVRGTVTTCGSARPEVGAGLADAVEARLGEGDDPWVIGPGVAEVTMTGRGEVFGLQPAGALLRDVQGLEATAAAEERDRQLHPGTLELPGLGVVELFEGDDGGGGDGLPHLRHWSAS